jgi:hypothetical protein
MSDNYIVIGDVHGRMDLLDDLLKQIDEAGIYYANGHKEDAHRLVFLGDFIDRGPDSFEVVERVKLLVEHNNAIALLGNHEEFAMDYYRNRIFDKRNIWFYPGNGGMETVKSYTRHFKLYGAGHFFEAFGRSGHAAWLGTLPFFYETEKVWFSHAPIPERWQQWESARGRSSSDFRANKELLTWTCGPDDAEGKWEMDHGKLAIYGHVHALLRGILLPRIYPQAIYSDTGSGCHPVGRLSAIIVTEGKYIGHMQAIPKLSDGH